MLEYPYHFQYFKKVKTWKIGHSAENTSPLYPYTPISLRLRSMHPPGPCFFKKEEGAGGSVAPTGIRFFLTTGDNRGFLF